MSKDQIPRQLSADPADPWWNEYWVPRVAVTLDGQSRKRITRYDADAGWIEVGDFNGLTGKWETIRMSGNVGLSLRKEPSA